MTLERRRRIEQVYAEALELPAHERLQFVADRCSGDDELRRAVEALLAGGSNTELAGSERAEADDANIVGKIVPGVAIGNYRVDQWLGRGGMGVVYRATDVRLNRSVAIKFLSKALLDAAARRRFQREAQMASTLNHPHILTVHDVGDYEGAQYLVTEFVDGGTLDQWVSAEPRTWRQIAELMIGVADALAAAHTASILHRDVKPANILVSRAGHAKLADFGLAKPTGSEAQLRAGTEYTRAGAIIGTLAYMSPEQLTGRTLDARSDVFAFGVVLYEVLAGRRPFAGHSDVELMHAVVYDEPASLSDEIPEALRTIVAKAIEKDPAERYQSMREMAIDLKRVARRTGELTAPVVEASAPPRARARSLRPIAAAAAVLVALAAVAGYFAWPRVDQERWARDEAIPAIARLTDEGDYRAAFDLAQQARRYAANDPLLASLTPLFTLKYTVTSTPSDANVFVRSYVAENEDWQLLGRTPLPAASVARRPLHWRFEKEGYEPVDLALSEDDTVEPNTVEATLQLLGTHPGMVFVPGGTTAQFVNGALMRGEVGSFFIDRYEVTNAEYKEFVEAGGYERPSLWEGIELQKDGAPLAWEEAMRLFVDATGRAGPAVWELGDFAEGQDNYPVTGISSYEAAAYARFRGKVLPTTYHWTKAALPELSEGGLPASIVPASNYGSTGLAAVGTYRGMGPFGTYDMHGNAAEWIANRDTQGRAWVFGGSWRDAAYNFFAGTPVSPLERSPTIGLRLMLDAGTGVAPELLNPITLVRPPPRGGGPPISDEVYAAYASQFAYARGELNASEPVTVETTDDWTKQRVTVDTGYGERMDIVLFVPKRAEPPYQALVYFPPADAVLLKVSSAALTPGHPTAAPLDFIVKSGRVLVHPIYKGTFERFTEPLAFGDPTAMQRRWLDWRWDIGRTLDYLETRGDIDSQRIGYLGVSFGASFPLHLPALESRFRVAMLVAGGTSLFSMSPSTDPAHYAPRIKIPALQINGRFDYVVPLEEQIAAFELLGTPLENKRQVIVDAGHVIPRSDLLQSSLGWLDEYLGPVR